MILDKRLCLKLKGIKSPHKDINIKILYYIFPQLWLIWRKSSADCIIVTISPCCCGCTGCPRVSQGVPGCTIEYVKHNITTQTLNLWNFSQDFWFAFIRHQTGRKLQKFLNRVNCEQVNATQGNQRGELFLWNIRFHVRSGFWRSITKINIKFTIVWRRNYYWGEFFQQP